LFFVSFILVSDENKDLSVRYKHKKTHH